MEIKTLKKELTPELKAKLNKFRAVKPKCNIVKYTPAIFKEVAEEKDWPVFEFIPLPSIKAVGAGEYITDDGSVECSYGQLNLHYFAHGLKGWSDPAGLFGIDFKPEFIVDGKLTTEAITLFPVNLIKELANEIYNAGVVVEEDTLSL